MPRRGLLVVNSQPSLRGVEFDESLMFEPECHLREFAEPLKIH
ncbi:hypothetical protein [Amycolatopsis speibonae]|uniref:Uncharacterized protein n=1 Tax=Amycolatopsis speibonae TaxID=1450224 RepID=A0ABV7NRF5_9PSEU